MCAEEGAMPGRYAFAHDVLEDRFTDLWELAENFQEGFERNFSASLRVDERHLFLVIVSAYEDIARYKSFHLKNPESEKSDAIKRSAYLTKWICRIKPIQVLKNNHNTAESDIDWTSLVNELFAMSVATIHLSVHIGRDFVLTPEKEYSIVYYLLYRDLNEDALIALFSTISEAASGIKIMTFI